MIFEDDSVSLDFFDEHDNPFFVFSKDNPPLKSIFGGVAFTSESIIVGQDGFDLLKDNTNLSEGRFYVVAVSKDSVEAYVDNSGQDALFYYNSEGYWAFSNSWLMLARFLKKIGAHLTENDDVINSFEIEHSMCQQLVSNDTPVNEIKVLPLGFKISLKRSNDFSFYLEQCRGAAIEDLGDYHKNIMQFSQYYSLVSKAILSSECTGVKFDITGGYDSRLVLSLVESSGLNMSNINFCSNPRALEDYNVACRLISRYGASIQNRNFDKLSLSGDVLLDLWMYGNLGVYRLINEPVVSKSKTNFHFHGAGGENFRTFYASSPSKVAESFKKKYLECGESFERQLKKSFDDLGVEENNPRSLLEHYRNFRSRFHFGRNTYKTLTSNLFSPLSSSFLWRSISSMDRVYFEKNVFAIDLMSVTAPELLNFDFDKLEKNFSDSDIIERKNKFSKFFKESDALERMKLLVKPSERAARVSENNVDFKQALISKLLETGYIDFFQMSDSELSDQIRKCSKLQKLPNRIANWLLKVELKNLTS